MNRDKTEERKAYYRIMALTRYWEHPELKAIMRENYHKKMNRLKQEPHKLAEYKIEHSNSASLYYSNKLWRDLYNANKDADWEKLYVIVRIKSIANMTDYITIRHHMEQILKGQNRLPKEMSRKVAVVMRESIKEYVRKQKRISQSLEE